MRLLALFNAIPPSGTSLSDDFYDSKKRGAAALLSHKNQHEVRLCDKKAAGLPDLFLQQHSHEARLRDNKTEGWPDSSSSNISMRQGFATTKRKVDRQADQ
ncbi:hypothetical protein [Bacteroides pyogenes]|uniref:hypothetical protein n=1 Tax=Bacteroides pyogenes TaxID=310300 RepID=UPI00048023F4|nr:hypothetical protein [Bacteroides pyogenes]MDY5434143.1 hypothetical protein [Bacteroides pyogenes]